MSPSPTPVMGFLEQSFQRGRRNVQLDQTFSQGSTNVLSKGKDGSILSFMSLRSVSQLLSIAVVFWKLLKATQRFMHVSLIHLRPLLPAVVTRIRPHPGKTLPSWRYLCQHQCLQYLNKAWVSGGPVWLKKLKLATHQPCAEL